MLARLLFVTMSASLIFSPTLVAAESENWLDDWDAALQAASDQDCDILASFTGTDWCIWCQRLHADVFDQQDFLDGIEGDFVLMEIDLPHDTSLLTQETLNQNRALAERFKPNGFPTVILADAQGRPYAVQGGYVRGGPEAYLELLAGYQSVREARDQALAQADQLQGPERAAKLREAMAQVDAALWMHYPAVFAEITAIELNQVQGDGPQATPRTLAQRYLQDRKILDRYADASADRLAFYKHRQALTQDEQNAVENSVAKKEFIQALELASLGLRGERPTDDLLETPDFQRGIGLLLSYRYRAGQWPVGSLGHRALLGVLAWAEHTRDIELAQRCLDEYPAVRANLADLGFMQRMETRVEQLRTGELGDHGFFTYVSSTARSAPARPSRGR